MAKTKKKTRKTARKRSAASRKKASRKSSKRASKRGSKRSAKKKRKKKFGWGGTRPGAGRKRDPTSGVMHGPREQIEARYPVHVTITLREEIGSLRRPAPHRAAREAFAEGRERDGFRLVHYSLQRDSLQLLVEARDRTSLSRGLQGLLIRTARGLNRALGRTGTVFADRYDERVLRTPREVRDALLLVLNYALAKKVKLPARMPDPYSSGDSFDGWSSAMRAEPRESSEDLVMAPRTQLLKRGWRSLGLLGLAEVPVIPPPR